ncbi:MAG: phosphoglycolate phosphatase [Hyphomicrobiales bacterium]|nr:phosphoglycolate phosphatase [Hyphomicrobiales bacterium]
MTLANNDAAAWPRAVVFDLDGTLIDSAPDIANALNAAMRARGFPPFEMERVKRMIGGGVPALVERAFMAHGVAPQDFASVVMEFLAEYARAPVVETRLYDGALPMLDALRRRGVLLGLCTNKQQEITDIILRRLGVAEFFQSVVGERRGEPRKPDPEPLRRVMRALGVDPADTVMVGDSAADAGCAQAAGAPVVLVRFGYAHGPVEELGAQAIISHLSELDAALDRLRASRDGD